MAKKRAIGLKALLMGPVAADGGMGTALTELVGNTVRGTASLTSTPLETTDILEEESDDPIESITTGGGVFTFVWSSYNIAPEVLVTAFGGTIVGGMWEAPDVIPTIEQSVKGETRNGIVAEAPRVKISADLALNMQIATPGQINFTGTILKPTKAATPKLRIGTPVTP